MPGMKYLPAVLLILAVSCASKVQFLDSKAARAEPAPYSVFVGGEVRQPGHFAWTKGMTLVDGIQRAGGFTDFVWYRWLEVLHWDGSGEKYRLTRDYQVTTNVVLRPGDWVISPRW